MSRRPNQTVESPIDPPEPTVGDVSITIPLSPTVPMSQSHRVHLDGHLRGAHGAMMLRIRAALDSRNMRLRDGKHVHTMTDAIKWLLEQAEQAAA